jgi:rhodanese-related sulfurtransferase
MKSREMLSIIILALGTIAAMLPNRKNDSIQLNEVQLLNEVLLETNYISADELSHLLISKDPGVRLIDVRDTADFNDPLPGAINIPVDSIFSDSYAYVFDQLSVKNVIYAGTDAKAVQVWMIVEQLGYRNNYLLKGGLDLWKSTILDPAVPSSSAGQEIVDLYHQRIAARQYFTGAKALPKVDFKPMVPIEGRKKKKVQGGCS